ncbi:MAG TPA: DUF2946 family protein [Pyrinomonadaceae bacterium]|jgi:hypothetical protein
MFAARLRARPDSFRRGAACLLLLLVTWNVTAELAHRHGLARPLRATSTQAAGKQSTGDGASKLSAGGVCLFCQFQQQLAHGVLQAPPFALRPRAEAAAPVVTTAYFLPVSNAPPCGRAPPPASLA